MFAGILGLGLILRVYFILRYNQNFGYFCGLFGIPLDFMPVQTADKNDTTWPVGITVSAVAGILVSWLTYGLFRQDIPFSPAVAGILM